MAGYSAPPQAYTRDTLVKAIDWIAHQPEQMRSQATNADTLVAFYLQSKRRTSTSSTHPVSGETFTEDLKNLAKDLEQFTSHQHHAPLPQQQVIAPQPAAPPQVQPTYFEPPPPLQGAPQHHQVPVAPPPQASYSAPAARAPEPRSRAARANTSYEATSAPQWNVDPKSWAAATALKERLNLSSEAEALRMMVSLGAERLSDLIP